MLKNHNPGCPCPSCGGATHPGCPCPVPHDGLFLTYDHTSQAIDSGGESPESICVLTGIRVTVPLTWDATLAQWESACYTAAQFAGTGVPVNAYEQMIRRAIFSCGPVTWAANVEVYEGSGSEEEYPECPGGSPVYERGTDPPPFTAGVPDPFKWYLDSDQCSPLLIAWHQHCDRYGEGGGGCAYIHTGPFVPPTSEVCVLVRGPDCGETPGDPIAGAEVAITQGGTAVGSGTTDAGGSWCLPGLDAGLYTATATVAGCVVSVDFAVGSCGGTIEVPVVVCCATVPYLVLDDETDAPIEGAEIELPDGPTLTTDAAGEASVALTTAQVLALPGSCGDYTLTATVSKPGYLDYCPPVAVSCDDDGSTPNVIRLVPEPEDAVHFPVCCGSGGCEQPSVEGRGYLHTALALSYSGVASFTFGGVTLIWTYTLNQTVHLSTLAGVPTTGPDGGLVHYRLSCTAGTFITPDPAVTGCGLDEDVSYTYGSVLVDLEFCRGEAAKIAIQIFPNAICNNAGMGAGVHPACDQYIVLDLPIPGDLQTFCLGDVLLESWTTSYVNGTINHTLSITEVV